LAEISNLKREQAKLAYELIDNYSYANFNLNITHILKCVEDYDNQLKYKSQEIDKIRQELMVLENNLNKNLNHENSRESLDKNDDMDKEELSIEQMEEQIYRMCIERGEM